MIWLVINILALAFSLIILAIGSQFTIKSIEDIIELTHLSEASIGFALLSVMTSIPEIFVATFAILHGKPGFSVGDILGSNVFNIGIVAGILGAIGALKKCSSDLLTELVDILFLSSVIPLVLIIFGAVHFWVGIILLGIFAFSVYNMTKKRKQPITIADEKIKNKPPSKKLVLVKIFIGIAIVVTAAEIIITSASNISDILGIAPILIGAKIIAIGTSMPELALDLSAIRRGRVHLAAGDIIGSNLTNITLVLGIILLASPFETINLSVFTQIIPFVLITTLILWRYLTKGGVSQIGGIALIITYIVFQATITA